MSLDLGDFVEDFGVPGLIVGIGAVVLAPIFGTALAKVGKPIAKAAIKTGLVVYEKSKVALAEAGEAYQDLLAESKAELAQLQSQKVLDSAATHPEVN
ncbi:MAG TPA: DUF5132 domain-containing protein [Cyanobacteria bacterium UBA8803]|nr:DUF5132 domain-containing protein [Cyanobacteria bacterium UBA8803]